MCYYLLFDSEVPLKESQPGTPPMENYRWQPQGDFPGQFLCGRRECPIWWRSLCFYLFFYLEASLEGTLCLSWSSHLGTPASFCHGTSPVGFCWLSLICLWFDEFPFCCYLFFDLEVSPRGHFAPLGTLSIGNSSWLPQQGLPSRFLLDVLSTWFDVVLLSCSCSLCIWLAIYSISPHIQSRMDGYNNSMALDHRKTDHYCHTIPGTCLKWMDTWSMASFPLGLRVQQRQYLRIWYWLPASWRAQDGWQKA